MLRFLEVLTPLIPKNLETCMYCTHSLPSISYILLLPPLRPAHHLQQYALIFKYLGNFVPLVTDF